MGLLLRTKFFGSGKPATPPVPPTQLWTARTITSSQNWITIAYGLGLFVATCLSTLYATSPDGINWTNRTMPFGNSQVFYGGGKFIAMSRGAAQIAYSTDGINWTTVTHSAPANINWTVAYGNGTYVAVGNASANTTVGLYSTDGITWNTMTMPGSRRWGGTINGEVGGIAFGGGKFVATTVQGTAVATTSTDGISWAPETSLPTGVAVYTYGNGKFVGSGPNVSVSNASSSDGLSWSFSNKLPGTQSATFSPVTNEFVLINQGTGGVGGGGAGVSYDGINMAIETLPYTATATLFRQVCYGGGIYVAIVSSFGGATNRIGTRPE